MKDEKEEVWNESKGKDQLIKRMVKAYKKKKKRRLRNLPTMKIVEDFNNGTIND